MGECRRSPLNLGSLLAAVEAALLANLSSPSSSADLSGRRRKEREWPIEPDPLIVLASSGERRPFVFSSETWRTSKSTLRQELKSSGIRVDQWAKRSVAIQIRAFASAPVPDVRTPSDRTRTRPCRDAVATAPGRAETRTADPGRAARLHRRTQAVGAQRLDRTV
jgi:hypothetical protein